jgi:hypothetical protein
MRTAEEGEDRLGLRHSLGRRLGPRLSRLLRGEKAAENRGELGVWLMGFPGLEEYEAVDAVKELGLDRDEFLPEVKKLQHRERQIREQLIKTFSRGH